MNIPHIPILRFGERYQSLDTDEVVDHATGEPLAMISQANNGLIRRDLLRKKDSDRALGSHSYQELVGFCKEAADIFLKDSIVIDDPDEPQSPDQFVHVLSRTTGLPHSLCRQNISKICTVLQRIDEIVNGLTRELDPSIFDKTIKTNEGLNLGYYPTAKSLGIILPSNSPAVNSLWLPAIVMKTPVVVKPGKNDPWTSWRIIQSLVKAGFPVDAFGYYPTSHDGANAILEGCDRSIVFGDQKTVKKYRHDSRISVHGSGYSKIVIGEDVIENWVDCKDILLESILANGGRSCINASTIIVPKYRSEIAVFLARELTKVKVVNLDDPSAQLAAFPTPTIAQAIDNAINQSLNIPGAVDLTMKFRSSPRLEKRSGSTFLMPTLIDCADAAHPLANQEYMFPFVGIVEVPQETLSTYCGPTLSLTMISEDEKIVKELLHSQKIDRLNIGPVPTTHVDWSQPHEGNLFEFLYHRIAVQRRDLARVEYGIDGE